MQNNADCRNRFLNEFKMIAVVSLVALLSSQYRFRFGGDEQETAMGLMDILNGMQNGPRGEKQPGSGGMSPITMALLGLLAYKAIKHFGGNNAGAAPAGNAQADNAGNNPLGDILGGLLGGGRPGNARAGQGGGLGDLGGLLQGGLAGGLGGLLAGGAAGGALNSGLNDLLKQFDQAGHGQAAQSWVGHGPNQQLSDDDLENALGSDTVNSLAEQAGLSRVELLSGLREQLPEMVNKLTPDGRLPTDDEMSRMI
jgi:uncharacterized protein YidB (DUF937 family)